MAGFLGMIGTLPFVCSHEKVMTFSNLQTERSVRYAVHEVIGKKPVLEFIGENLSRVSFQIRFDSSLGFPPNIGLMALREMMKEGSSKRLLIGPEYMGKYVIESIGEERKFHTGAGVCSVAVATISLTECNQ